MRHCEAAGRGNLLVKWHRDVRSTVEDEHQDVRQADEDRHIGGRRPVTGVDHSYSRQGSAEKESGRQTAEDIGPEHRGVRSTAERGTRVGNKVFPEMCE